MLDWWNVLASVTKVNVLANYLTIIFLVLTAASGLLSFTSGKRILALKKPKAEAAAAPAAAPVHVPAPAAVPPAPTMPPPAPAAVPPAPTAPQPAPAAAPPRAEVPLPPKAQVGATVQMAIPPRPAAPAPAKAEDPNQRHLTKEQKDRLVSLLNGRPKGQVSVTYMANDVESQTYFNELVAILGSTGWKMNKTGPTSLASAPKGIHFQIKTPADEPENAKYLIHSFMEAGIKPSTELNRAVPASTLVLIVGHKP